MNTAPDPKTVQELATEHILDDARRAHDIGAAVIGHFGPDALTKAEYHAYCDAVREAITTATIAVSWPVDQPQDERDARIAELEREVRQLRAGAPRAWKQDWHDPISRFETFVNVTRNYDSDHLGGIMRGGNAEATITLGDLRAVHARLAELETQPAEPLRPEYGVRVVYTSTIIEERTVGDTLGDALAALERLADRTNVISCTAIQRPVGAWRKLEGNQAEPTSATATAGVELYGTETDQPQRPRQPDETHAAGRVGYFMTVIRERKPDLTTLYTIPHGPSLTPDDVDEILAENQRMRIELATAYNTVLRNINAARDGIAKLGTRAETAEAELAQLRTAAPEYRIGTDSEDDSSCWAYLQHLPCGQDLWYGSRSDGSGLDVATLLTLIAVHRCPKAIQ